MDVNHIIQVRTINFTRLVRDLHNQELHTYSKTTKNIKNNNDEKSCTNGTSLYKENKDKACPNFELQFESSGSSIFNYSGSPSENAAEVDLLHKNLQLYMSSTKNSRGKNLHVKKDSSSETFRYQQNYT